MVKSTSTSKRSTKRSSKQELNTQQRADNEPKEWPKDLPKEEQTEILEAWFSVYQRLAQSAAERLSDGDEKREMIATAEFFNHLRPSTQERDRRELEILNRQMEVERKTKDKERNFVIREFNRMVSLPDPVFVLDLPDTVIEQLASSPFDSVGKLLFGVTVSMERATNFFVHEPETDLSEGVVTHSRHCLIQIVGQEGYNLIGSRLIQYGYLQRNYFLSELNNETVYKPAKGRTDNK